MMLVIELSAAKSCQTQRSTTRLTFVEVAQVDLGYEQLWLCRDPNWGLGSGTGLGIAFGVYYLEQMLYKSLHMSIVLVNTVSFHLMTHSLLDILA